MDRAWAEINKGAELVVPSIFYFIIKFVTPVFLLLILVAYVFQPVGRVEEFDEKTQKTAVKELNWTPYVQALVGGPAPPEWEWSGDGLIGKLLHRDIEARRAGVHGNAKLSEEEKQAGLRFLDSLQTWRNIDRLVMAGVFVFLCSLVAVAWRRRAREGSVLG
jgi:neurotransmitter:Na+ symporter, NSS family